MITNSNHHETTSIRQHEQTSNDYSTERRNENDNTCKLVEEEDRTILEPTAHITRLPFLLDWTQCFSPLSSLGRTVDGGQESLNCFKPIASGSLCFVFLFYCAPAATTAGLPFFFAYTMCHLFSTTPYRIGSRLISFKDSFGVGRDGRKQKSERERKSNIRDGVFESSPSRSFFLGFPWIERKGHNPPETCCSHFWI
jgi:hypothetical protein